MDPLKKKKIKGYLGVTEECKKEVVLADRVTTIVGGAFYKKDIGSVKLSDSLTSIEGSAFSDNQLKEVKLPDLLTTIGLNAFFNNNIKFVTIPSSVTTIHEGAFDENPNLSVCIHASYESRPGIDTNAFHFPLTRDHYKPGGCRCP